MAKKSKNHEKHVNNVIQSLKDLGVGGKETLARLATTVRADAPTVILAQESAAKKEGRAKAKASAQAAGPAHALAYRAKASLSRMAVRFNPRGEPAAQRQVAKELKRLHKRVKRVQQGPKPRKSRLPYVIAMGALLGLGGGYWAFTKIPLPSVHVAQYLDYRKWLDHTAGHDAVAHEAHRAPKAETPNFVVITEKAPATRAAESAAAAAPKRAVLPKAPHILVQSSSKGAVGVREVQASSKGAVGAQPARIDKAAAHRLQTASYHRKSN